MANMKNDYRTVRLPQGSIRYYEKGTGEPILFVHGLLVNGSLWRKVVPLLAGQFRCIVPDWPLGANEAAMNQDADLSPPGLAKLVTDFITALDLRSVTLVGNDTGGAICQIVATEYPERVSRLVLTNCDCFDNFPPMMFRPLQWDARIPGFLFLLSQLLRFQFVRQLPVAFGWLAKRPIERAVVDDWLRPMLSSGDIRREVGKLLKGISSRYTIKAAEKLKNFTRPVLLAWGPDDRFFPYAHAQKLSHLLPNARLERIDDSFTFVSEDQPERLAELIKNFMIINQASPFHMSAVK
jgi:pimeloyl-ACP methyl ester carboxylesterase